MTVLLAYDDMATPQNAIVLHHLLLTIYRVYDEDNIKTVPYKWRNYINNEFESLV